MSERRSQIVDGKKFCPRAKKPVDATWGCERWFPVEEFGLRLIRGLYSVQTFCKACQSRAGSFYNAKKRKNSRFKGWAWNADFTKDPWAGQPDNWLTFHGLHREGFRFNKSKKSGTQREYYQKVSCKCDPDRIYEINTCSLIGRGVSDCGCKKAVHPGQVFGNLVAIKKVRAKGGVYWVVRCRCPFCRKHKEAVWNVFASELRGDRTQSCGRSSFPEYLLFEIIRGDVDPNAEHDVRFTSQNGSRMDILLRGSKQAVEYNGGYWHSLEGVPENDAEKARIALEEGWELHVIDGGGLSRTSSDALLAEAFRPTLEALLTTSSYHQGRLHAARTLSPSDWQKWVYEHITGNRWESREANTQNKAEKQEDFKGVASGS